MLNRLFILFVAMLCSSGAIYGQTFVECNAERSDRGLTSHNNVFVAKGQWAVGGSASYSAHVNDNYNLLVVENIESMGYNFDVSGMFVYAYANNSAIGARVIYDRDLLKIENSDLSFGDESSGGVSLSMDDCYLLKHSYSLMAILRQYIPLGRNKRFALYNEIQFEGGGSQSKYSYDSPVQGTYSTSWEYGLNFSPGVVAFITNRVAFEINVGAMGMAFTQTKQLHNQVESGESRSSLFNFKVNILSLGFGITYYL